MSAIILTQTFETAKGMDSSLTDTRLPKTRCFNLRFFLLFHRPNRLLGNHAETTHGAGLFERTIASVGMF